MNRRSLKRQLLRYLKSEATLNRIKPRRLGHFLVIGESRQHSEGFSSWSTVADLRDLTICFTHDGQDCDGRYHQSKTFRFRGIDHAHTRRLRSLDPDFRRAVSAHLEQIDHNQRDYAAEAAGF